MQAPVLCVLCSGSAEQLATYLLLITARFCSQITARHWMERVRSPSTAGSHTTTLSDARWKSAICFSHLGPKGCHCHAAIASFTGVAPSDYYRILWQDDAESGCEIDYSTGSRHGESCNKLDSFESFVRQLVGQVCSRLLLREH